MQNFTQALANAFGNQEANQSQPGLDPRRTIFIADLPKSITYLDLSDFFE